MKSKIIKLISFLLLLSFFSSVNAFDYRIWQKIWTMSDSLKYKADLIVKKKINTPILIQKYLKALRKLNVAALNQEKQALYYYLLSRLDSSIVITNVEPNQIKIDTNSNSQISNITSSNSNPTQNSIINTNPSINEKSITNQQNTLSIKDYSISEQKPINVPLVLSSASTVSSTARLITYSNLPTSQKTYIESIKAKVGDYAEVNNDYEFQEFGKTYRIKFKEYYNIDFSNPVEAYQKISSIWNEILLMKWNAFILSKWGFSLEQKLTLTDIKNNVKFATLSDDPVLFQIKNWFYFAYSLYDYKYFIIPESGIYLSQFNNLPSLDTTLLIKKEWKYFLVTDFWEYKLFDISILKYSSNPLPILKSLWKDLYFYKWTDYSTVIQQIKQKTEEIISWTTNDSQRIQKIYSWLTSNLTYDSYTTDFVKWKFNEATYTENVNNEVFTWIWTYKSKNWVCDWFTKLLQYMLTFAWVQDVIIEIWNADVWGGKLISHAWINIWNLYYDPTWDLYSLWDISKFKRFWISQSDMYKNHYIWIQ